MGLLTPCFVPRGGLLYTMVVSGGRAFAPFESCLGGMVLDEIDRCIRANRPVRVLQNFLLVKNLSM